MKILGEGSLLLKIFLFNGLAKMRAVEIFSSPALILSNKAVKHDGYS